MVLKANEQPRVLSNSTPPGVRTHPEVHHETGVTNIPQLLERAPRANLHTRVHQDTAVLPVRVILQRDRNPPLLTSLPRLTGHLPLTDPRLRAGLPLLTGHPPHPTSLLLGALPEDVYHPAAPHLHPEAQEATQKDAALHPPTARLAIRGHPEDLPPVGVEHRPAQNQPEAFPKAQHGSRRNKRTT